MNLSIIGRMGQKGSKIASKAGFWASKHAPELCYGAGAVGFVGTCIFVGKGTLKAKEIVDEAKADFETIKEATGKDGYSEQDRKQDIVVAYVKEVKGLAKCYAPAFCFGVMSLTGFTGGHYILRKRNMALVAAYGVLSEGFKNYRANVIEKYGEDEDYRLNNNLSVRKESVEYIDEEGKKKRKKVDVDYLDDDLSGYSFIYDDQHSMANVTDPVIARDRLRMAQSSANVLLDTRGYITLNEVLRSLGLAECSAGQIVGWVKKGEGDGYVDFRYKQIRTAMDPDGVAFLLDFNVDGPIYQEIDKYTRRA